MANATAPVFKQPDEILEELVLQNEDKLDAITEAHKAEHPDEPEGPRSQVHLLINGEMVPVIDQPEDVKHSIATEAVNKRAENYDDETLRYATFKLEQLNEVEAVDAIRELSPGDRQIWLRAERDGQDREAIFTVFGQPEGE